MSDPLSDAAEALDRAVDALSLVCLEGRRKRYAIYCRQVREICAEVKADIEDIENSPVYLPDSI